MLVQRWLEKRYEKNNFKVSGNELPSGHDIYKLKILEDENLVHLRLGIGEFSGKVNGDKDLEFSEDMLNMLDTILTTIKNNVQEIIKILISSAMAVKDMFIEFKNLNRIDLINKKIIEVNDLEEQGDRAYENLISELYKNEKDAITLIKWTSIYNSLEQAIDFCEQVSDCVEDVILINS